MCGNNCGCSGGCGNCRSNCGCGSCHDGGGGNVFGAFVAAFLAVVFVAALLDSEEANRDYRRSLHHQPQVERLV
jgi:hypothetical protein